MITNKISFLFVVCLFAIGLQSCDSDDEKAPVSSAFSEDKTLILTGESVQFSDNSTGATSWKWTFANGNDSETITSSEQNPTITFNNYGLYTVTLEVSNGSLKDSSIKTDQIAVDEMVVIHNNLGSSGVGYNTSGGGAIIGNYQHGNSLTLSLSTGTYTLKSLEIGVQKYTNDLAQNFEMLFCADSSNLPDISSATDFATFSIESKNHQLLKLDATSDIILQNNTKYWFTMNHATFSGASNDRALWLNTTGTTTGSVRAYRDTSNTTTWGSTSNSVSSMKVTARRSAK
jgi:PKD repeat protein